MLFEAKVGLARATAVTSRTTGRGGGTTLPGRLLLRLQADALQRLAERLPKGAAVVSATNGKTTTAKMAASDPLPRLRACAATPPAPTWPPAWHRRCCAPRAPTWACSRWTRRRCRTWPTRSPPRALVLGQPVPRPARPLRRARAGGRALARPCRRARPPRALVSNADDPLVASLGDATATARLAFGHRRSRASRCRAAARRRLEVVRALRRRATPTTPCYLGHLGD